MNSRTKLILIGIGTLITAATLAVAWPVLSRVNTTTPPAYPPSQAQQSFGFGTPPASSQGGIRYVWGDGLLLTGPTVDLVTSSDFTFTSDALDLSTHVTFPGITGNAIQQAGIGIIDTPITALSTGGKSLVQMHGTDDTSTTVAGIDATGWSDGDELTILNSGEVGDAASVIFTYEDTSALANDRIITPDRRPFKIGHGGVTLRRAPVLDGSGNPTSDHRWHIIATIDHEKVGVQDLQFYPALNVGTVTPLSGTYNDFNPTGDQYQSYTHGLDGSDAVWKNHTLIRVGTDIAGATITGMYTGLPESFTDLDKHTLKIIINFGPGDLKFKHLNVGSSADYQFQLPCDGDMVIPSGRSAVFVHHTKWQVLSGFSSFVCTNRLTVTSTDASQDAVTITMANGQNNGIQVVNSGTGQTPAANVQRNFWMNMTGSYDATANNQEIFGVGGRCATSRSAGVNAVNCYAIYGDATSATDGTSYGLFILGRGRIGGDFAVTGVTEFVGTSLHYGNVSIGDATADAHSLKGTLNLNTTAGSAGEIAYINGSSLPVWGAPSAAGVVDGTGTLNYIPMWTPDGNTIGNSLLRQAGTNQIAFDVADGGSHVNRPIFSISNVTTTGAINHRADLLFTAADTGGVVRDALIQNEGGSFWIDAYGTTNIVDNTNLGVSGGTNNHTLYGQSTFAYDGTHYLYISPKSNHDSQLQLSGSGALYIGSYGGTNYVQINSANAGTYINSTNAVEFHVQDPSVDGNGIIRLSNDAQSWDFSTRGSGGFSDQFQLRDATANKDIWNVTKDTGYTNFGNAIAVAPVEVFNPATGAGQTTADLTDAGSRNGLLMVTAEGTAGGAGGGILFANSQGHAASSIGMAAIKGMLEDGSGNTAGGIAFSTRGSAAATNMNEVARIYASGVARFGGSAFGMPYNDTRVIVDGAISLKSGGETGNLGGGIKFDGVSAIYRAGADGHLYVRNPYNTNPTGAYHVIVRPTSVNGQVLLYGGENQSYGVQVAPKGNLYQLLNATAGEDATSFFGSSGASYGINIAGNLSGDATGAIWHNAYFNYAASGALTNLQPKWRTTHGTFGSRGIAMSYAGSGGTTNGGIGFYADTLATTADTTFSPTLRMLIENSGNVGINNSDPTLRLDVAGAIRSVVSSGQDGLVTGTASKQWTFYPVGSDLRLWEYSTTQEAGTGNDRMVFEAGGNIGINVTNPDYKFEVNGTIASNTASGATPSIVIRQASNAAWTIDNPASQSELRLYSEGLTSWYPVASAQSDGVFRVEYGTGLIKYLRSINHMHATGGLYAGIIYDIADVLQSGTTRKNVLFNSDALTSSGNGCGAGTGPWDECEYGHTITYGTSTQVSPRGVSETVGQLTFTGNLADFRAAVTSTQTGVSDVRNQTWTFSVWVKAVSGTPTFGLALRRHGDVEGTSLSCGAMSTSTWRRCQVTATWTNTSLADNSRMIVYASTEGYTDPVYVYGAQLEAVPPYAVRATAYQKNDSTLATANSSGDQSTWSTELRAGGTMQHPNFIVGTGGTTVGALSHTWCEVALATGLANDFSPTCTNGVTFANTTDVRADLNGGGNVALTGMAAGVDGRTITIHNVGIYELDVYPENSNSVAANRIVGRVSEVYMPIPPGGSITLTYRAGSVNRWLATALNTHTFNILGAQNYIVANGVWEAISGTKQVNFYGSFGSVITDGGTISAATTNDLSPGDALILRLKCSNSAGCTITGLSGGRVGRWIRIFNDETSTETITFPYNNIGSSAANRFFTWRGESIKVIRGQWIDMMYDTSTSRWRVFFYSGGLLPGDCTQGQYAHYVDDADGPYWECIDNARGHTGYAGRHMEWTEEYPHTLITNGMGSGWYYSLGDDNYVQLESTTCGTVTGPFTNTSAQNQHVGILELTPNGTGGRCYIKAQNNAVSFFDGATWTAETAMQIDVAPTGASGSNQVYRFGFIYDFGSINTTHGCYFAFDPYNALAAPASGSQGGSGTHKWECWCADNTTRTAAIMDGTGGSVDQAVAADTWYWLKMVVNNLDSVDFYVNGTKSCTISTNLPQSAYVMNPAFTANNNTAGGGMLFRIDWLHFALDQDPRSINP